MQQEEVIALALLGATLTLVYMVTSEIARLTKLVEAKYRDDTNGVSVWLFKKTAVKYQDPPDALYTADQLAAAVLAEREECAKVCDEVGGRVSDSHAWDAAAAIRARGNA